MIRELKADHFNLLSLQIYRSSRSDTSSGYKKERFFDEVPNLLLCTICKEVVNRPIECESCRRLSCKKCIETNLSYYFCSVNKFSCMACKHLVPLKQASPALKKHMGKLIIKCKHPECPEYIEMKKLENHEKSCQMRSIHCSRGQCNTVKLLKDSYRRSLHMFPSAPSKNEIFTCSERCFRLIKTQRDILFKSKSEILGAYKSILLKLTPIE